MIFTERSRQERAQLASGERPPSRFTHPVQRLAAKALVVFFVLMLGLTLLSRAADSVTVARVNAEKAGSGILTQRVSINGKLEALGDLELKLPAGIRVERTEVAVGDHVEAGDVLLRLDTAQLSAAIEKLESDLKLLDLKLSGGAAPSDESQEAIDSALLTLQRAQDDYQRLVQRRESAEGRIEEDLAQNQANYDKAVAALSEAQAKAKTSLIKAAEDAVAAAAEALETSKLSAKEANDTAQETVDNAQSQQTTVDSSYFSAVNVFTRAQEALAAAQRDLDAAEAGGDAAAISAAKAALYQAQAAFDAAEASLNSLGGQSTAAAKALKRAKENLTAVAAKWKKTVDNAQADLDEANATLTQRKNKTDFSEESTVIAAQNAVENAQRAINDAQRGVEDAAVSTEDQLLSARRAIETAEQGLASARRAAEQKSISNAANQRQTEIERLGYISQRRELVSKLDDLKAAAAHGSTVVAPISGTVLKVREESGVTQDSEIVAVLSRADEGFQFTGKVDQRSAEFLAAGDFGTLSFTANGNSNSAPVNLSAISTPDSDGMVTVTVLLPPDAWSTGISATVEVSKRSQQYHSCLPLSALRNKSGSDYVLVIRETQGILGTEQTVVEVPITVEARDGELAAIRADGLQYNDLVVTHANKPIEKGDRVRLEIKEE